MVEYNKTQLSPDKEFEKHIFNRDQFAHYLRWTYVLKISKLGNNILDFGCGTGNLAEVLYRNRHRCIKYLGLDIREQTIKQNKEKFKDIPWIQFEEQDLIKMTKDYGNNWDIICSFETLEHINKKNINIFLSNISNFANKDTIILISTPNFDKSIGAAKNHIYDGEVQEWEHNDLQKKLEEYFIIKQKFGTFASIKDYKHLMNDNQKEMFNSLSQYYDSNLLSVIFAPLFPEQSRNTLWILSKK